MNLDDRLSLRTIFLFLVKISPLIGAAVFALKIIEFALFSLPNLDEGVYLFQGLSYARGDFEFLQPYGFFTGKIYFTYFVWGWIQQLFGAGLTAPRVFTIILNMLSLLGITLILRKQKPAWVSSLAIWTLALNSPLLKMLSLANSQVIIFFMVTWIIFFYISLDHDVIGVFIGTVLLALLVLSRENMIFFVVPSLLYIFWDKGKKLGLVSLITFASIFIYGNYLYYPEILSLWSRFLPRFFESINIVSSKTIAVESDSIAVVLSELQSVVNSLRVYSVELFGTIASVIMFFTIPSGKYFGEKKKELYLVSSFIILFIPHVLASIGLNYCIFCLTSYIAFFINIGIVLTCLSLSKLSLVNQKYFNITITLVYCIFIIALWISYQEVIGRTLLSIPFPIIREYRFHNELTTIGAILANKFHFSNQLLRQTITFVFGIISIPGLIITYKIIRNSIMKRNILINNNVLLITAMLLSFFLVRMATTSVEDNSCRVNVVQQYGKLGVEFKRILPADAKIFIDGSTTPVLLLYLDNFLFYPPQINQDYSFKNNRLISDTILKDGHWNAFFRDKWLHESNVLVFEKKTIDKYEALIDLRNYNKFTFRLIPQNCEPLVEYFVYVK